VELGDASLELVGHLIERSGQEPDLVLTGDVGAGLQLAPSDPVRDGTGLDIAFVFPVEYVAIALLGTVLLSLVVMLAPLRRAVRFKPGEAIRYA
jgi:ABC-type lipoprotein release transport system permease subunit